MDAPLPNKGLVKPTVLGADKPKSYKPGSNSRNGEGWGDKTKNTKGFSYDSDNKKIVPKSSNSKEPFFDKNRYDKKIIAGESPRNVSQTNRNSTREPISKKPDEFRVGEVKPSVQKLDQLDW